ncbi:MAG: hypothetical protein NVSMB19_25330 [Vulcanimicrobiaceae bacterium]
MTAGDVAPLQLLSNLSLATATGISLVTRGPNGVKTIASGVVPGTTILTYPGGSSAPGFWVAYTTTALDFPISGHYEVSIVASIAGVPRVCAIIPLLVNATAGSS